MTQHKIMYSFTAMILCTFSGTLMRANEIKIFTKILGQQKVKDVGSNTEHACRLSKVDNNWLVVDNKRHFSDDEGTTWYPLLINTSKIQCESKDYQNSYELKNKHFIVHDGKNYRVNFTSDIYCCIGNHPYELENNQLIRKDDLSFQADDENEIGYESEEDKKKDEEKHAGLSSPSSSSSSSTSSTPAISNSSTKSNIQALCNPQLVELTQNHSELRKEFDNLSTTHTQLKNNIEKLEAKLTWNTNSINPLATEITRLTNVIKDLQTQNCIREIENSHLKLNTQTRLAKACDFVAAAGAWAWPALRFAPLIAPIALPAAVTYGAAALSLASLIGYWKTSLSQRITAIETHNKKSNTNNPNLFKLTNNYIISNPHLTAFGNRLWDFASASVPVVGGAALFMLAQKNKASMPAI